MSITVAPSKGRLAVSRTLPLKVIFWANDRRGKCSVQSVKEKRNKERKVFLFSPLCVAGHSKFMAVIDFNHATNLRAAFLEVG
ncbi:MAG: hypothetical protein EAZ26_10380 [Runella slithyformis]|nr:MAG: hypothetical protein EAZ26_10380 [Runella slithyformis]